MKMNKILAFVVFLALFATPVFADEGAPHGLTFEDLGVGEPKILPGDSLYFLKNWGREIGRFFSFGAWRKAIFETGLANKFVAEIKVLGEKNDEKGLSLALENYRRNAERLGERVSSLAATSGNPNVGKLLDMLADRVVKHEQVFEGIESAEVGVGLEAAREALAEAAAAALEKLDTPENFKIRVENLTSGLRENSLKDARVVYALNRIEGKMPQEFRDRIREIETDLISRFEGRFKAEPGDVISHLNLLPVRSAANLSIFDEIRERVTDGHLKSELNLVRFDVLGNGAGEDLGEDELTAIIGEAEKAVEELKSKISSEEYASSRTVGELLERAEFHLVQAKSKQIFGQATAARAAAQNGLSQLRRKVELKEENYSLRVQFDDLARNAREKSLTRETSPELYGALDRVERAILEADTESELRNAKVMLAELEVLIMNNKER